MVDNPNIGGLFVDGTINYKGKWVLIPFAGTNHDAITNIWSYSVDKKSWIIDEVNKE